MRAERGRLTVCRVDEVPEDGMAAFRVDGLTVPVLVVRHGGRIAAVSGMCPHEDVELEGGHLDELALAEGGQRLRVVCPGHGYCFDVDTGACVPDGRLRLPRYRTTVADGVVVIELFPPEP